MGVSAALVRALGISFLKLVLGGGVRQIGASSIWQYAAWTVRIKNSIRPTEKTSARLCALMVRR